MLKASVHVFHFNYLVDNRRHVAVTQRASKAVAAVSTHFVLCASSSVSFKFQHQLRQNTQGITRLTISVRVHGSGQEPCWAEMKPITGYDSFPRASAISPGSSQSPPFAG